MCVWNECSVVVQESASERIQSLLSVLEWTSHHNRPVQQTALSRVMRLLSWGWSTSYSRSLRLNNGFPEPMWVLQTWLHKFTAVLEGSDTTLTLLQKFTSGCWPNNTTVVWLSVENTQLDECTAKWALPTGFKLNKTLPCNFSRTKFLIKQCHSEC